MEAQVVAPRHFPRLVWLAVLIALASAGACYAIVGANLGLFFGGIVLAALLVPPMTLTESRTMTRLLLAGAVCDGIALIWLIPWFTSHVTFVQWLICYALLITWCLALAGIAAVLDPIGSVPAAAITTVVALLWLSSPIWLWPHVSLATNGLVSVHPLFAVNSTLVNLGIWTERPIAYRYLLTLGQDVPYELPHTILPAAMLHLLIGAAGVVVSGFGGKFRT